MLVAQPVVASLGVDDLFYDRTSKVCDTVGIIQDQLGGVCETHDVPAGNVAIQSLVKGKCSVTHYVFLQWVSEKQAIVEDSNPGFLIIDIAHRVRLDLPILVCFLLLGRVARRPLVR